MIACRIRSSEQSLQLISWRSVCLVTDTQTAAPLTMLKEEENLFRAAVRDFAEEAITPFVASMDGPQWMKTGVSSPPCCPSCSTSD